MALLPTCPVGLYQHKTPDGQVPCNRKFCVWLGTARFGGCFGWRFLARLRCLSIGLADVAGLGFLAPSYGPVPGLWGGVGLCFLIFGKFVRMGGLNMKGGIF